MKIILNGFKHWVSEDPAEIKFGQQESICLPPMLEPPIEITAESLMAYHPNTHSGDGRQKLAIEKLCYLLSINGGTRDMGDNRPYTTRHQSYHLYQHGPDNRYGLELVICSVNGCGNHWFFVRNLCVDGSILSAVKAASEQVAWDLLYAITGSYEHGLTNGTVRTSREYASAFVNGKLKKRKKRGDDKYTVEIEP